jgi:hypothetical protein
MAEPVLFKEQLQEQAIAFSLLPLENSPITTKIF